MDVPHIRADGVKCIDRIGLAVHDEIRRIEIDAQIVKTNIRDRPKQRHRRLLPGFEEEILPVLPAVPGNILHCSKNPRVIRIMRIFRHIANMRDKVRHAEFLCKVGALLQHLHPLETVRRRHQSQRLLSVIEIPGAGPFPAAPEGGNNGFIVCSGLKDLPCFFLIIHDTAVPADDLAAADPEPFKILKFPVNIILFRDSEYTSYMHRHTFPPCDLANPVLADGKPLPSCLLYPQIPQRNGKTPRTPPRTSGPLTVSAAAAQGKAARTLCPPPAELSLPVFRLQSTG